MVDTKHLKALIILADRCRSNGLIGFDEFPVVFEALSVVKNYVDKVDKENQSDQPDLSIVKDELIKKEKTTKKS